jgi:hypothetical protein
VASRSTRAETAPWTRAAHSARQADAFPSAGAGGRVARCGAAPGATRKRRPPRASHHPAYSPCGSKTTARRPARRFCVNSDFSQKLLPAPLEATATTCGLGSRHRGTATRVPWSRSRPHTSSPGSWKSPLRNGYVVARASESRLRGCGAGSSPRGRVATNPSSWRHRSGRRSTRPAASSATRARVTASRRARSGAKAVTSRWYAKSRTSPLARARRRDAASSRAAAS